jgi:hypothetical protein
MVQEVREVQRSGFVVVFKPFKPSISSVWRWIWDSYINKLSGRKTWMIDSTSSIEPISLLSQSSGSDHGRMCASGTERRDSQANFDLNCSGGDIR